MENGKIYLNRDVVPALESGQWAWVTAEKGADPWLLAFGCPCGTCCGAGGVVHNSYLAVSRGKSKVEHQWEWDGDWHEPTLSPSIQRRGACDWHGWFRSGLFVVA